LTHHQRENFTYEIIKCTHSHVTVLYIHTLFTNNRKFNMPKQSLIL
jgi:hypothetical protein